MSIITVNGAKLYYEETGSGEETLLFSHSFMWRIKLYESQIEHFANRYRCVAYEHRGHGRSEITESGYYWATYTKDAIEFIEQIDCAPCHYIGTSMGGMVGLRIGYGRPELLKSLTLIGADPDPMFYGRPGGVGRGFCQPMRRRRDRQSGRSERSSRTVRRSTG